MSSYIEVTIRAPEVYDSAKERPEEYFNRRLNMETDGKLIRYDPAGMAIFESIAAKIIEEMSLTGRYRLYVKEDRDDHGHLRSIASTVAPIPRRCQGEGMAQNGDCMSCNAAMGEACRERWSPPLTVELP